MPRKWPHASVAAVSLTFDGGTPAQRDLCNRLTDLGRRATVFADPARLLQDPVGWRKVVEQGHELGNHAFYAATDEDGLIARMSEEALAGELDDARALLTDEFGCVEHSAAMPLVRTFADDTGVSAVPEIIRRSIVRLNEESCGEILRDRYDVIRTPLDRFNQHDVDLQRLRCCCVTGLDAVSIGLITQIAVSQSSWAILSWSAETEPDTVVQIVRWLKRQPVWVAPVIEVASHLRESSTPPATFTSM